MATTTSTDPEAPAFDLALTESQALVQRTARDFATEKLLPIAHDIDEHGTVPPAILKELASLGFMGVYVPEELGGAGADVVSYILASEEINRACASTGVIMQSHNSLACDPILHFGTKAQQERWLRPLACGDTLGCFALTEPASGSDAAGLQMTAKRDGSGWRLSGTKNFITNGVSADVVVAFAQSEPGSRHKGITAFIVDKPSTGLSVGRVEQKLGIKGSDTAQLVFDGVRVEDDQRLGQVGDGFKIALAALDGGRIGIAAQAVGIGRACLEDALAYAKERQAFGKPIAELQAIQWMLADMATEVDAARLMTWRAATLKDRGERFTAEAAMAKLFASDVAMKAARSCVQIFGGYGYLKDFPAERHYRDAKITEIYEGTSEIMKLIIAEDMLE
ncbi:MAG TPA: acyl-CoA dehydrogenase [Chloroflexi bacterium]|jgi:butyryl-CoA dehydrogenase|nr:acyl-CoA dehydrogenase [Chloroflexota bacterium]HAL26593.1 acyl-CoA dehydrogenase [Chloroflexota bacterium]